MNDKDFEKQKARIKKFIRKWENVFELDQWDIIYYWTREYDKDDARANVRGRWQYRHALIEFFLPEIADEKDDDIIEKSVIHELIHIILLPMSKGKASNEQEYTTVSLQRAIVRAYLMGLKEKK